MLIPLDGSENALKALDFAFSIANTHDDTLLLLHVIPERDVPASVRQYLETERIEGPPHTSYESLVQDLILGEGEKRARDNNLTSIRKIVECGKPARVIVATAERENADMIVMGTRGLSDIKTLALGSTAHAVMHLAKQRVITVK